MDLITNKSELNYTRCIMLDTVTATEKSEMIISDTIPDVEDILYTNCGCYIKSKECRNGVACLGISANGSAIVLAEGRQCKADFSIPMNITLENSDIKPESQIIVSAKLKSVSASIVNPRKLSVTVTVSAECKLLSSVTQSVTSSIDEKALSVRKKAVSLSYSVVSAYGEKQYVIADELKLPDDKKPIGDILFSSSEITCDSVKTVGTKAIINCTANTFAVYSSPEDGAVDTIKNSTRYTQIIELNGEADEDEVLLFSSVTGVYMNSDLLASSEERRLSIEIHVLSQCMALRQNTANVISDAFSTKYALNEAYETISTETISVFDDISGGTKLILECEKVKSLLSVSFLEGCDRAAEDGILSTGKAVCVYLDNEGLIKTARGEYEISAPMSYNIDESLNISSMLSYTYTLEATAIVLSISVKYAILRISHQSIATVSSVTYDETKPLLTSNAPSFVIKRWERDSDLWSLSKKYLSNEEAILIANNADSVEKLNELENILIPKALL